MTSSNSESSATNPRREGHRILIADDDQEIREMFRYILSSELPGCEIDLVSNGEQAVKLFTERQHGVLLLDLHMPVMDGADAFILIQDYCKENSLDTPAAIFVTAYDPPHAVREMIRDNPVHCLMNKPIRNEDLVDVVKTRLGKT